MKLEELLKSGELHRIAAGCKTQREFANKIGLHPGSLRKQAALLRKRGIEIPRPSCSDIDIDVSEFDEIVPVGHHIKGMSTLVDGDGQVKLKWIKTNLAAEQRFEDMLEAIRGIADSWETKAEPIPSPAETSDELMCVIPIGDSHFGMHAWAQECGEDFDLKIAERNLVTAVDHLVSIAPPAHKLLLINLGDFTHADGSSGTTTSGTRLDVDTRWSKVIRVAIRAQRRMIERGLERFGTVDMINARGNHDMDTSVMLSMCLAQFYERESRVRIEESPAAFHYHRFGSNLIGVHHGHGAKLDQLPGIMASDRPRDWGETTHRRFYVGHVHHDQLKEYPGCIVETKRTLAARDHWHTMTGYRAGRDLTLDVFHAKHGLINRHTVGIEQIIEMQ